MCVPLSCKYPLQAGRLQGGFKPPSPGAVSVLRASPRRAFPSGSASPTFPHGMAPKRQSSLPPQPKKPKQSPAPKPEKPVTSSDLPKGGMSPTFYWRCKGFARIDS